MKKIVAIMMAVMMLIGAMACAQAATSPSVPSITTPDVEPGVTPSTPSPSTPSTSVPSVTTPSVTGSDVVNNFPEGFILKIVDADEDLLKAIMDFAKANAVIEYFGQEAIAKAVELVPEDADLMTAEMDEFMGLECDGYKSEFGDIDATLTCVTTYKTDDVMLSMVGYEKDGATVWAPLKTSVDTKGRVVVTFTQEVLEAITGTVSAMALLRME